MILTQFVIPNKKFMGIFDEYSSNQNHNGQQ
jgi:hypothetical protein